MNVGIRYYCTMEVDVLEKIEKGRYDPVYFAEVILGIQLHEGQKRWLASTVKPYRKRNILVPGNSFGKTVISAVKQLYYLFYKIGLEGTDETIAMQEYRTAHLAPHSEQVNQCYNYMVQILTNSFPTPNGLNRCLIPLLAEHHAAPRVVVKLKNQSTMQGFSTGDQLGSSFQGAQFGLITFDECCRDYHLEKVVTEDCLPRLIKYNAPLDLISTPWTESKSLQYYYHICQKGRRKGEEAEGWYTQEGSIDENTFYSDDRKEQVKRNMLQTRPDLYDQVVSGKFIFTGGREFSGDDIENIFKGAKVKWHSDRPIIEPPNELGQYVLAWDWAFGDTKESSWSVMTVINVREIPWKIVYFYRTRGSKMTPDEQYSLVESIVRAYHPVFVVDGQSAAAHLVVDRLQHLNPKPFTSAKLRGRDSERKVMILRLQQALTHGKGQFPEYGKLKCDQYIEPLASELSVFNRDDKVTDNDCVMSLGMAVNYYDDVDVKLPYVVVEASEP